MKRLLLATYYFPPHLVPESLMTARTIKSLVRSEWDVTVLTNREKVPGTRNDQRLLESMPSSLSIKRIGGIEHIFIREMMLKPFNYILGLPEREFFWLLPAVFAGKRLMRNQRFDIIYTRACCHTNNIVGLMLKRGSGLPWVAHFSDPWVDNPFHKRNYRQDKVCRRLEEAVIREADAVVFITDETLNLVMSKYPAEWCRKAIVIPHGYDADHANTIKSIQFRGNRFRIVYTGAFYGTRSPEWLFYALQKLINRHIPISDFEIVFVGPVIRKYLEMSQQLGLNGIVTFTGPLKFSESLDQAASADLLLVIDAPNETKSVFLPSKLVDYLMFGKPILGLTPQQGASANLLKKLNCHVITPDDVDGIAEILEKFLIKWKTVGLSVSEHFNEIAQCYHIDQTTKILVDCFERLTVSSKK